MKPRLACHARERVPRANGQAIVTAIDAVAHRLAEFVRNMAFVLDRQIRNAAPRIDLIGRGERARGTHIETSAAGAAVIMLRLVGRDLQRREDRPEKQPGTIKPRHEIGVLALPTRAGRLRQWFLHYRRGVDEHLHVRAKAVRNEAGKLPQLRFHHVVIVVALRVAGDRGAVLCSEALRRIVLRPIVRANYNDCPRFRPECLRIGSSFGISFHPVHGAMALLSKKCLKIGACLNRGFRQSKAHDIETLP